MAIRVQPRKLWCFSLASAVVLSALAIIVLVATSEGSLGTHTVPVKNKVLSKELPGDCRMRTSEIPPKTYGIMSVMKDGHLVAILSDICYRCET